MKRILFTLCLLSIISITSCSKDDDNPNPINDEVTDPTGDDGTNTDGTDNTDGNTDGNTDTGNDDNTDTGTTYFINYNGLEIPITSAAIRDYGGSIYTYNYDFTFRGNLDGTYYTFFADLYSPKVDGQAGFRTGTFEYSSEVFPGQDIFYFINAVLIIGGETHEVTSGSIVVGESTGDSSFSFSTDITLENQLPLSVSYEGEFQITLSKNSATKM